MPAQVISDKIKRYAGLIVAARLVQKRHDRFSLQYRQLEMYITELTERIQLLTPNLQT